jgi:rhodanese-related sulfurtransferase
MNTPQTLLLIAALLGGALYYMKSRGATPSADAPLVSGGRIHGERAEALVKEGALLLDVRTPAEFAAGHLDGAINIPVQVLKRRVAEVPKDRVVIVYCRSGARSAHASRLLLSEGHTTLYDLGPMRAYPH